jgi:hypothetical protein
MTRFGVVGVLAFVAMADSAHAAIGPAISPLPVAVAVPQAEQSDQPEAPGVIRPRSTGPRGGVRSRQEPPSAEGRTVAEVEQLFDAYVARQARQFLRLTPDQMRDFGPRLRQLQMTRRRTARQRQMLLRELNDLTRAPGAQDDEAVAAKMAALDQQSLTASQQLRAAYQAVEEVLTVQQRGRLRVFEQQMERQKLELMARAREAARSGGRGPGATPPADVPAADLPNR